MTSPLFRLFNRLMCRHSNLLFRGILRTPPVESDPTSPLVLYSLACKRDLCAYLLAVKSLLQYAPSINIVLQSDGSIDESASDVLRQHISGITIISREDTDDLLSVRLSQKLKVLVRETNFFIALKLLNPILRFSDRYVIHLDSDILFLRRPDAILDCLSAEPPRAFYCPGGNVLADAFHKIGFDFSRVDIRSFNSGLMAGHISFGPSQVEQIADEIRRFDPSLLRIWDVEQAIWAVLMNACENPLHLRDLGRDYVGNGWSTLERLRRDTTVVHFVGATRFRNLLYPRLAHQVISNLAI